MLFRNRVIKLHITISLLFVLLTLPVTAIFVIVNYRANLALGEKFSQQFINTSVSNTVDAATRLFNPMLTTMRTAAALMRDQQDFFRRESSADYLYEIVAQNEAVYAAYASFDDGSFRQVRRAVRDLKVLGEVPPAESRFVSRYLHASEGRKPVDSYIFHADWGKRIGERSGLASYDPRTRGFYKNTIALNEANISDPYLFASSGELGVTVSAPVETKGRKLGVVSVDFTLKTLSQYLADNKVSPNGLTIIADESGGIVAHPAFDQALTRKGDEWMQNRLDKLPDPRVTGALAERLRTGQTHFLFHAGPDNAEYIGIFSPFPDGFKKDWELLIIAPTDDFIGEIKRTNRQLLIFGVIALMLQIALILRLSRSISRPIEHLADEISHVRDFRFEEARPVDSHVYEIKRLAEAVNLLTNSLASFISYVPKDLVQRLVESGRSTKLGVQSRYLTMFFTDIENFSTLSEVEPSQQLLARVSEYFSTVTHAIEREHGTVDKFIGDSVMAFWGAPTPLDDHAYLACVAAVRAQRGMAAINREWVERKLAPLRVRIGLHADAVMVGNVGSVERLSYTVMGDGVNVASRLEGINKELGTWTCVSHSVYREAGERLWLRPIDTVSVKGRKSELLVYELLAVRDGDADVAATPDDIALCEMTTAAYALYERGRYDEAADGYSAVLDRFPKDPVARRMLEKCRAHTARQTAVLA